jgi:ferredoxin-type protein NapH
VLTGMNHAPACPPAASASVVRRPVRHLPPPASVVQWLHRERFMLARRALQFSVLLLFYGTLHWGWKAFGQPVLTGNLSSGQLLGAVPLADPFAVLQMLVARHLLAAEVLLGAAITLALYALVGGRVFCAWVCPMNLVTDAAAWIRNRIGMDTSRDLVRLPANTRYVVLALSLLVSALAGVAAFDAYSPIAMLHRELIYGVGLGLGAALGVLLIDALVIHRGWCGHLCPLGAFWSLVGRVGQVKVAFDDASCSRCGDCVKVCPEPRVLHFADIAPRGMVVSGECTSCGRCVAVCPEKCLEFDLRLRIRAAATPVAVGTPPVTGGSS